MFYRSYATEHCTESYSPIRGGEKTKSFQEIPFETGVSCVSGININSSAFSLTKDLTCDIRLFFSVIYRSTVAIIGTKLVYFQEKSAFFILFLYVAKELSLRVLLDEPVLLVYHAVIG